MEKNQRTMIKILRQNPPSGQNTQHFDFEDQVVSFLIINALNVILFF